MIATTRDLGARQYAILKVLRKRPAAGYTDEELVGVYADLSASSSYLYPRQSESGIRTRRSELVKCRLVVDSGKRRKLRSGNLARVWVVA